MNRMNYRLKLSVVAKLTLMAVAQASKLSTIVWLALVLFAASASAAPFVYVVTSSQQFGTVDLATGNFHAIGNPTPDSMANLVWGPDGTLYSLTASGRDVGSLAKIDTRTGEVTDIGSTGLGYNAFSLAGVRGKLYLTDFSNNLYLVNPETGVATPIAATGMPPDPNIPFTFNNDGTFNLCDEGFYGVDGELYATFDSFALDPNQTPPTIAHVFVSPALYRIDPDTGNATFVAETDLNLSAFVDMDEKVYAFRAVPDGFDHTYNFPVAHSEVVRLDLRTGKTGKPTEVDASVGLIFGAAPIRRHR
jgi:hypothetical protein